MRTFFLLLVSLSGCANQQGAQNKDVADLRNQLKTLDTPLVLSSRDKGGIVVLPDSGILRRLFNENAHFSAVGRLFESEDFISILGYYPNDVGIPILITLDRNGNEIESLMLFGLVGIDIGYYQSNYVTIHSDRTITVVDTLLTRAVNEDRSDEIPGTDSLTVSFRKYKLNDNGKFEMMDETIGVKRAIAATKDEDMEANQLGDVDEPDGILGVWTDGSGPNASFRVEEETFYDVEHFDRTKYELKGDSLILFYADEPFKAKILKVDRDSFIYESEYGVAKFWRFRD